MRTKTAEKVIEALDDPTRDWGNPGDLIQTIADLVILVARLDKEAEELEKKNEHS